MTKDEFKQRYDINEILFKHLRDYGFIAKHKSNFYWPTNERFETYKKKRGDLNIYQKAIESLNEGMDLYEDFSKALKNELKYKHLMKMISNFTELLLINMVEKQSPLLCYEKPYSTNIDDEKIINYSQALQILKNFGVKINNKLINDIKKLINLQNKNIHLNFENNIPEIIELILRVLVGLRKLYKFYCGRDIIDDVREKGKKFFRELEAKEKTSKNKTSSCDETDSK